MSSIQSRTTGALRLSVKESLMRNLPDSPAPASSALEKVYYKKAKDVALAVRKVLEDWL